MIIGVPREVKDHEYRVAMVPAGVAALVDRGHTVIIETDAGRESGIADQEYAQAGAQLRGTPAEVFAEAEMIVKVKEPLPQEYDFLREGQIVFAYLHLAPAPELAMALLEHRVVGIAYETVQLDNSHLPLLTPMSEVAGKLSIQVGAHWLQKENGGSGVLLGGVPGTEPAKVAIIGAGTVGVNAAKVALGMGSDVTILDINLERLRYLADILGGRLAVLASNELNIAKAIAAADLVVGALLIPGAKTPKVISKTMLASMRPGSVVIDVSIDQGGCVEGAVPTTHGNPVIREGNVTLFCVTNLPACVAKTSTFALTNATLPYVAELADLGWKNATKADPALAKGLNVVEGKLVNKAVAEALGRKCAHWV